MLPEDQKRILGYFIEEAKDHLNTIEQGLLNLQATIEDSEVVNEVFRAAHSVKGGAAMLGLESIQHTSHRLEDYFKILKESPIQADRTLESMLLQIFDALQEQLEHLQGPFGLTDDKAQEILATIEPVFDQVHSHLESLVRAVSATPAVKRSPDRKLTSQPTPSSQPAVAVPHAETSALQLVFKSDVPAHLRTILGLFKQADSATNRQEIQNICQQLFRIGEQFELPAWCALVDAARRVVGNQQQTFRTLAPLIIKEIKGGQDLVLAGQANRITVSLAMQDLLPLETANTMFAEESLDALLEEALSNDSGEADLTDLFATAETEQAMDDLEMPNPDAWFEEVSQSGVTAGAELNLGDGFDGLTTNGSQSFSSADQPVPVLGAGPEVGAAELNSLADLFEGEISELDNVWEEEEISEASLDNTDHEILEADIGSDFADLMLNDETANALTVDRDDDLASLFGDALLEENTADEGAEPPAEDAAGLSLTANQLSGVSTPALENDPLEDLWSSSAPSTATQTPAAGDLDDFFSTPDPSSAPTADPFAADLGDFFVGNAEQPLEPPESSNLEAFPEIAAAEVVQPADSFADLDVSANLWDSKESSGVLSSGNDRSENSSAAAVHQGSDLDFDNLDFDDLGFDDLSTSLTDKPPESVTPLDLESLDLDQNPTKNEVNLLDDLDFGNLDLAHEEQPAAASEDFPEALGLLDLETDVSADLADFDLEFPAEDLALSSADEFSEELGLGGFDLLFTKAEASPEAALEAGADDFNAIFSIESESTDVPDLDLTDSLDDELDLISAGEEAQTPDAATTDNHLLSNTDSADSADSFEAGSDLDLGFLSESDSEEAPFDEAQSENFDWGLDSNATPTADLGAVLPEFDLDLNPADALDAELDLETSLADFDSEPSLYTELLQETSRSNLGLDLENSLDFDLVEAEIDPDLEQADALDLTLDFEDELEASEFNLNLGPARPAQTDEEPGFSLGFEDRLDFDLGLNEATADLDVPVEPPMASDLEGDFENSLTFDLDLVNATADINQSTQPSEEEDLGLDLVDALDFDLEDEGEAPGPEPFSLELTDLDESEAISSTSIEDIQAATDEVNWLDLSLKNSEDTPSANRAETPTSQDFFTSGTDFAGDLEDDLWGSVDDAETTDSSTTPNLDGVDAFFEIPEIATPAQPDLAGDFLAADLVDVVPDATDVALEDLGDFENTVEPSTVADDPFGLTADSNLSLSEKIEGITETNLLDFEEVSDSNSGTALGDFEADFGVPEAAETESFTEAEADLGFDELDSLLEDDAFDSFPTSTAQSSVAEDEEDDFADLDALLEEETESNPLEASYSTSPSTSVFVSAPTEREDEFEDLEKLLEEADQLGGSAPAMGLRRAQASAARRSPRRAGVLADQTMRVSVKHLDNLSNLVGELVVNRNSLEQDQERLRQFLDNLLFQVQQLNDVGQRMRDLYERSLLESSLISSRQSFQTAGVGDSGGSHATGVTFDALEMDRFTGFHTLSQEMIELIVRVRESSSDIAFTIESTDQITRQFRQVTTQLQEGLNKARMVPFAQTADRLPRAVRDISLKCGKEAKLVVEGRDTLIDKMILERLYDPMTHLVNNAITHGVETPEERITTGKPREGTITVRAFYQGNQTVIYIADDGAGINSDFVKEKALKRGLITPSEARAMTRLDVYELLFLPGFSTRDQADDFAGRGVGMDVVRTALSEIRGSVTIDSEMGKGTSFTIRLPLTLSISKALSCVNNQARIAFPMDGVEDMFDAPRERVQMNDQGQSCILWRDTLLPFRPLSDLLQFNRTLGRGRVYGGHQDDDIISIVVLRSANTYIALEVDQVIGEQEIVIKQLEGPVPKPIGIAGATVLGDGRVMPIADVLELIDLSMGRVRRDPTTSLWSQSDEDLPPVAETPAQAEPTVLIVDDSITVRELLSMSFNKVGYRVEQARDGQEAWEKLRSGLPCDLVFCDIEMPRMDGLELLSRMQKDSALSGIPIAMLTSRGADRHRQMAIDLGAKGYFTKPYLEEVLLDAAQRMLNGENMSGGTKGG